MMLRQGRPQLASLLVGALITAALVVPILAFAAYTQATIDSDITARSQNERLGAAKLAAELLRVGLEHVDGELRFTSRRDDFRAALRTGDRGLLQRHLGEARAAGKYPSATVFSAQGVVLAIDPPSPAVGTSVATDPPGTPPGPFTGPLMQPEWAVSARAPAATSSVAHATIGHAVRDGTEVLGVLSVALPPELILASLAPIEAVAGRAIVIVNQNNRVIASTERQRAAMSVLAVPDLQRAVAGEAGGVSAAVEQRERAVVYAPIVIGSWALFVIDDPSVVLASERRLTEQLRLGATAAAITGSLLAVVIAALFGVLRGQREALDRAGREKSALLEQLRALNAGLEERVATQVAQIGRMSNLARFLSPQVAELVSREGAELGTHRRETTVLFADVRGFTSWSESLEPEELIEMLNELLGALTEVVFENGGTLDKYLGDGVMAFFGDPVAQPDHAERAVRCGLGMQERLMRLQAHWFAQGQARLTLGVGINSGWVTAGTVGARSRSEYTVIGDNVNIASRLAAAAGAGDVLISEKTWRSLHDSVEVEPRGELAVKGKAQPVNAFAALRPTGPRVSA